MVALKSLFNIFYNYDEKGGTQCDAAAADDDDGGGGGDDDGDDGDDDEDVDETLKRTCCVGRTKEPISYILQL